MGRKASGRGGGGGYGAKSDSVPNARALADAACEKGEAVLDSDPRSALQCFEEALQAAPTHQNAWYLRGVASAELWEEEPPPSDRQQLLQIALDSFGRVFALDTSTRSETRYLSCLARGKLLTNVGIATEGQQSEAFAGADESFKEAYRLVEQWGHEAFDAESWGIWGEALSQQMRLEASLDTATVCGKMDVIATLCEAASSKFSKATSAEVSDPEAMDADDGGDTHWMMMHVEHLLIFVEHVRKVIKAVPSPPTDMPWEVWTTRAESAFCEAIALADAAAQLAANWKTAALRGDTFSAAAGLLGVLSSKVPAPCLKLPNCQVPSAPTADGVWECVEMPSYAVCQSLNESEAVARAEAAYADALASGGPAAIATVGLALGELRLSRGRRMEGEECMICLRGASEAFQSVAALKLKPGDADEESVASAWYNLACVAGLLGRAEHAAQALNTCLKLVDAGQRSQWIAEALEDEDLQHVRNDPLVQSALSSR